MAGYCAESAPLRNNCCSTSGAMSPQVADEARVKFHDVADKFSEEEWKLLHEWQEELYSTVMKEIHQALNSLGPLIANSVFSLRIKEKEDICLVEPSDAEKSQSFHHKARDLTASSDSLVKKMQEETKFPKRTQKNDRKESRDCPNTGIPFRNSAKDLGKEWEFETSLTVRQDAEVEQTSTCPNSGFPFLKSESSACFMDRQCAGDDSTTNTNLGHTAVMPEASFSTKRTETSSTEPHHYEKRENVSNSIAAPYSAAFPFPKNESEVGFIDRQCAGTESSTSLHSGCAVTTPEVPFCNKEGDTYCIAPQDLERREQVNSSTAGLPFLKTEPAASFLDRHCAGGESIIIPSMAGHAVIAPVASFGRKEEREMYSRDHQSSERRANLNQSSEHVMNTEVVSFKIKDEGQNYFTSYQDTERREKIINPTGAEHLVTTPSASFGIKENGETYHIDLQDSERRESIDSASSSGRMKRKRKDGDPALCLDVIPCKAPSGKAKPQINGNGAICIRQLWSEDHQRTLGDRTAQGDAQFTNGVLLNKHQRTSALVTSDLYNEWESNLSKAKPAPCPPNPQQNMRPCPITELEQALSHTDNSIGHQRPVANINTERNKPYPITENEKSVSPMKHFFGDQTTQMAEKPYTCTQCDKSFSQMASLNRHQRTHSKERPYQCLECDKSFNRKDNLIRHQRSHAGDFQAHLDMLPTSFELQNESIFGPMQMLRRTFTGNARD
ncbi:uncharacterized protein [Ambystoma mexicanum]|uniref:uncharacterized protein isoform X4 n=1 Tax=Ambystoma mexicanum TaxID=8296 RepID=UPI0037E9B82C